MKIFYFKRYSNRFDDIVEDPTLKPYIDYKIVWLDHLMLGFADTMPEESLSYLNLKYGDDVIDKDQIVPDRSPRVFIDYIPKQKEQK